MTLVRGLDHRLHGRPQVDVGRESEIGRHDSDDGVGAVAELEDRTEDPRIRSEPLSPETIIDNDDGLASSTPFFGVEVASDRGSNAQHWKQLDGNTDAAHLLRLGDGGQVVPHRNPSIGGKVFENVVPVPIKNELRHRQPLVFAELLSVTLNRDQPFRILVRQRPKQDGVRHREDGGIGADGESHREDDDGGDACLPRQSTKGVAEISEEIGHESPLSMCRSKLALLRPDTKPNGISQREKAPGKKLEGRLFFAPPPPESDLGVPLPAPSHTISRRNDPGNGGDEAATKAQSVAAAFHGLCFPGLGRARLRKHPLETWKSLASLVEHFLTGRRQAVVTALWPFFPRRLFFVLPLGVEAARFLQTAQRGVNRPVRKAGYVHGVEAVAVPTRDAG